MRVPAKEHLDDLAKGARRVASDVEELTHGMSKEQLLWRPEPERWGIADCLEHLVATASAYHPAVQAAIDKSPPVAEPGDYRPRLLGRLFIRSAGPEGRMRISARGAFVPPPAKPDVTARFRARQEELLALLHDSVTRDLNRTRVPSPVFPILVLTLGECLEMLVQHERRHLAQARRVRTAEGFPGPGGEA
jgi:hypothetical protein